MRTYRLLLLALLISVMASSAVVAQQSYDGKIDIAKLELAAGKKFDTTREDVILLFDGESVTRQSDGRFSTLIHRIIWIRSDAVVDEYGDLRIPFDADHCVFRPLAVRTWREGKWWPTDSTGIVETLPFAVDHAYDYTGAREMMLLLNGMEVPCILEIAYRIDDRLPDRGNIDGTWSFVRDEPVVQSRFEFSGPHGFALKTSGSTGLPVPQTRTDQSTGLDVTTWQMESLAARQRPHGDDPATDVPHVTWSTWASWRELGAFVDSTLQPDLIQDPGLLASADSVIKTARTKFETARSLAGLIANRVALVDYSSNYWWHNPRKVDRIYQTAYAHKYDRIILAAAMFRRAGFTTQPLFFTKSVSPIENEAPSLSRLDGIALRLKDPYMDARYEPIESHIDETQVNPQGHTVWSPRDDAPHFVEAAPGKLDLRINLKYDKDKAKFVGTGLFAASGGLSPYDDMVGLAGESKEYIGSVLGSLLKGTSVTEFNPEQFTGNSIAVGFTVELAKIDPDDQGRTAISIGKPRGGIMDHLPPQTQLFRAGQLAPIRLLCPMSQRIEARVDLGTNQVLFRPVADSIVNAAGRFAISSEIKQGQLIVVRELSLTRSVYQPDDWPLLRELLVAEGKSANGLILFKEGTETKK